MSEQSTLLTRTQSYALTSRPFVITVCSGKGGVGKSIVSSNLALGMASQGLRVVVWDTDITFPNQHILFGVEPSLRSHDVYEGMVAATSALFPVAENVRLLAGKTGIGPIAVSPQELQRVQTELLQEQADVLLLDTAAGSADDVLQCCLFADLIIVVVTDEPPSIVDAYGLIKILQTHAPTLPLALLVNNTIDAEDAEEVVRKMNVATERFLKRKVGSLGFIPYDRSVRVSIVEQTPLLQAHPSSEAARAIALLARSLSTALRKQRNANKQHSIGNDSTHTRVAETRSTL